MADSLDALLGNLPQWLEIVDASGAPDSVVVRTDIIGAGIGRIDLLLKPGPSEPSVEELNSQAKQLPDFCFERHIMPDRSFCLGHIEGASKLNDVEVFWCKLRVFLENQDFATRFGVWPIEQGMSHSETSMKAQKLIEDMIRSNESLLQEWLHSAFRGKGWISKAAHRKSNKSTPTYTARQACPRGCSTLNPHQVGCQIV